MTGEEVPSAYGAPPGFSRGRFSNLTNAYVLPPGGVYAGLIYEGGAFRHGPPDHLFTEEVEVGLPDRFGVAFEVDQERFDGDFQNKSFSVETRYALADWNKIPVFVVFSMLFGPGGASEGAEAPASTRNR